MDPLSVISGIAGISTAGATLVSSLYTLVQTVRHAPRHMREVAKEMASLTCTLEHLHEIISDGHAIASRRYFHGIMSVVSSIRKTQDEILDMIEDQSIIRRLKWSKAKSLLADIHTHKSTVSMQVVILTLGIVKKDATHKMRSSQCRLRKQAECLVQDCKDSLDSHDKRAYRDTRVPAPPAAPVPPDSKLQSPPLASDWQKRPSTTTGTRNKYVMQPAPHVEETTYAGGGKEDAFPMPSTTPKQEEERKHTITPFDRNSHFDAAALLYDLVFAGGSYMDTGKTNGTQNRSKEEEQKDSGSLDDTEFEDLLSSADEADYPIRRQHRVAERRARREQAEHEQSGETNQDCSQPGLVVDHLLLQWTSLNMEEIKSGEEATPNGAGEIDEDMIRGKVRAIALEASAPYEPMDDSDWYSSEYERIGDIKVIHRRRRWSLDSQAGASEAPRTHVPPRTRFARSRTRAPSRERRGPTDYQRQRSSPQEQPEPRPYPHEFPDPFSPSNGAYRNDPNLPRGYPQYFGQSPFYGYQTPYGNYAPYPGQGGHYWPPPPPPPPTEPVLNPASQKFDKPKILVLRPAYELNEGKDVPVPRLDALDHGLHLSRQGGGGEAGMVWNADDFAGRYGLDGAAVLGALVNDKSAVRGTDLLDTFVKGHRLPMVYVRGSDLGETWFLDTKPVFVLFYHAAYKPQFFPAKAVGGDEDTGRREYVAVGEEWVRQEALDQLGIVLRERRDGRLILDPNTTHAEIEELVRTSHSLVWLQQRRKYADTFYTPVATFRATHEAAPSPPPPPAAGPEPTTEGGRAWDLDGASPVPDGPVWLANGPRLPSPPPMPTIHIEEVATPRTTTTTTSTLVGPEDGGAPEKEEEEEEYRPGPAFRERSPLHSSREWTAQREGGEGRNRGERHEDRSRHPYGRHHHRHDPPRDRAPSGGPRHLDARGSYESASVRSGEGDDESRERRRRRRRRARTDEERREDREDRRSQGGSDSGFASLFSFAKGGLRK